VRPALESLAKAIDSYPRWAAVLERILLLEAEKAEERRLRGAHGFEVDKPSSGQELLKTLRCHCGSSVPPTLTADDIETMRSKIGLNPGGRHAKKTPQKVVAEFIASIGRRQAKTSD
jgi:hypothetical protein